MLLGGDPRLQCLAPGEDEGGIAEHPIAVRRDGLYLVASYRVDGPEGPPSVEIRGSSRSSSRTCAESIWTDQACSRRHPRNGEFRFVGVAVYSAADDEASAGRPVSHGSHRKR